MVETPWWVIKAKAVLAPFLVRIDFLFRFRRYLTLPLFSFRWIGWTFTLLSQPNAIDSARRPASTFLTFLIFSTFNLKCIYVCFFVSERGGLNHKFQSGGRFILHQPISLWGGTLAFEWSHLNLMDICDSGGCMYLLQQDLWSDFSLFVFVLQNFRFLTVAGIFQKFWL